MSSGKAVFFVFVSIMVALTSYALGIRAAHWVAVDNLVSLLEVRRSLGREHDRSLVDAALDANVVWLRKYGWAVLPQELDPFRSQLRQLNETWSKEGRTGSKEWKFLATDENWIRMQQENTNYLRANAR